MRQLEDRVAIITGAGAGADGIGRQCGIAFAGVGAQDISPLMCFTCVLLSLSDNL